MNRMRMQSIKDGARQRRKYLWKKAAMGILAVIGALISVALALCALLVASSWYNTRLAITIPFYVVLILVLHALLTTCLTRHFVKRAKSIPYVPPVIGQSADLPADEVLLRASVQPTALSEELLRAARQGTVVSSDELLRAELTRSEAE